jgi:hypothetical protein
MLIAATAFIGLIAYPWLQPGSVMVHQRLQRECERV